MLNGKRSSTEHRHDGDYGGGKAGTLNFGRPIGRKIEEPTTLFIKVGDRFAYPNHLGELVDGGFEIFDFYKDTEDKELRGKVKVEGVGRVSLDNYVKLVKNACKEMGKGHLILVDKEDGVISVEEYRAKSLYNHSQLEELREGETEEGRENIRARRLGIKRDAPPGWETPLGHTYSIILETLAREGINVEPTPQEFLDYIKSNGGMVEPSPIDLRSFNHPTHLGREAESALKYMREKGLSAESCERLMFDITGKNYSAKEIERKYPMSD